MNVFFRGLRAVGIPGCYLQNQKLIPLLFLMELPLPLPLEKRLNAGFMIQRTKHFETNGNLCFNSRSKFQKVARSDTFSYPEADNMENNACFPFPS